MPRFELEIATYVVEPQSLFAPFLTEALTGAGLDVCHVSDTLNVPHISESDPDVVLIDMDFLNETPRRVIEMLRRALPQKPIFVYGGPAEHPVYDRDAVIAIPKEATLQEFIDRIFVGLQSIPQPV